MTELRRNRRRLLIVAALLALFITFEAAWTAAAPVRGRMAARYDVWHGNYKILLYGLPPASRAEYVRLLAERYQVQSVVVAFCTPSPSLRAYVDHYDAITAAAANKKFGHDIFEESYQEAERTWASQRAAAATLVRSAGAGAR